MVTKVRVAPVVWLVQARLRSQSLRPGSPQSNVCGSSAATIGRGVVKRTLTRRWTPRSLSRRGLCCTGRSISARNSVQAASSSRNGRRSARTSWAWLTTASTVKSVTVFPSASAAWRMRSSCSRDTRTAMRASFLVLLMRPCVCPVGVQVKWCGLRESGVYLHSSATGFGGDAPAFDVAGVVPADRDPDSTAFVRRRVPARVGGTPSRDTVKVAAIPSRSLAAARQCGSCRTAQWRTFSMLESTCVVGAGFEGDWGVLSAAIPQAA